MLIVGYNTDAQQPYWLAKNRCEWVPGHARVQRHAHAGLHTSAASCGCHSCRCLCSYGVGWGEGGFVKLLMVDDSVGLGGMYQRAWVPTTPSETGGAAPLWCMSQITLSILAVVVVVICI